MIAAEYGKVQAVKWDDWGRNLLPQATFKGNKGIIDTVLSQWVDIESKTKDGETPLWWHGALDLPRQWVIFLVKERSLTKKESDKCSFMHAQWSWVVSWCFVSCQSWMVWIRDFSASYTGLFPPQRIGKNTGNNLTDCFNANVMLANFLEVI